MSDRAYVPLSYVLAALAQLSVAAAFAKSPLWREAIITHFAGPIGLATLAIGATRRDFPVSAMLDVVAAGSWALAVLCLAYWTPLMSIGQAQPRVVDLVALSFGVASVALACVALQVAFGAKSAGRSGVARSLQAVGLALLAFYIGRLSWFYYESTRVIRTGGIEALSEELIFGLSLVAVAVLAILGSACVAWTAQRRVAA